MCVIQLPLLSNSLDRRPLRVYRKTVESIETQAMLLLNTAEKPIERAFLALRQGASPGERVHFASSGFSQLACQSFSSPCPALTRSLPFARALCQKIFLESTATEQAPSHGAHIQSYSVQTSPLPRVKPEAVKIADQNKLDTAGGASLSHRLIRLGNFYVSFDSNRLSPSSQS